MIFAYRQYELLPTPDNPTGQIYRPVIPVRVIGPKAEQVILGLVDTGSDVTVLPSFLLPIIGVADKGESAVFRGVGGQQVIARYGEVVLKLDDNKEAFQWSAKIGFLEGRDVAILGFSGFLERFEATFNSERRRLHLSRNRSFPDSLIA